MTLLPAVLVTDVCILLHISEYRYMLDHVSITVTNIGAAEKFYDAIMSALGVPKVRKSEPRLGYG